MKQVLYAILLIVILFGILAIVISAATEQENRERERLRDKVSTRYEPGPADTWSGDVPSRRIYGVGLIIHESAGARRIDTVTANAYGTTIHAGEWRTK